MRIVVALGGNALLKRGEPMTADRQRTNIRTAVRALAPLAQRHELVLSHGNGPQVRLLALQAAAYTGVDPYPLDVPDARTEGVIGHMIEQGSVVICNGGGGIPVMYQQENGHMLTGVEAVIDKDFASGLLAQEIKADLFVMETDVNGVYPDRGKPSARFIHETTPSQLKLHTFPAGSMGPKVEAACAFVEKTGKRAAVGALAEIEAIVDGDAGTRVCPDG